MRNAGSIAANSTKTRRDYIGVQGDVAQAGRAMIGQWIEIGLLVIAAIVGGWAAWGGNNNPPKPDQVANH